MNSDKSITYSIEKSDSLITITQNKDVAIIYIEEFNININTKTEFLQPNSKSIAVIRVTGDEPSIISGAIRANGKIVLINPNGISTGNEAKVEAAGILFTTFNFNDSDLNSLGKITELYNLYKNNIIVASRTGTDKIGEIENNGIIQAKSIENDGEVVLFGHNITLSESSKIHTNTFQNNGNGGKIIIQSIDTVTVSGILDASAPADNGLGGQICILGNKVWTDNLEADASGGAGGGNVLLGGGFKGNNPDIPNALYTYVSKDSVINADALVTGDGGMVVLWSDKATCFSGFISSTGGKIKGDGGFVEVSSKEYLSFHGKVNTLSTIGTVGTLLLDPNSINIVTFFNHDWPTGSNLTNFDQFADPDFNDDGDGTWNEVSVNAINGAAANVVLQAVSDINFNTNLSMTNNGIGITAQAGNNITVNNTITTRGGIIDFIANDSSTTQSGTGSIIINAQIDTSGNNQPNGNVNLDIDGGTGSIQLNNNITTRSGFITFNDNVLLTNTVALDTTDSGASPGGATITFAGTLDGNIAGNEDLTLNAGTAGNIDFDGVVGATRLGAVSITNANNVTADNSFTATSISQTNGGGTTTFTGNVNTNGAAGIILNGTSFTFSNMVTTTNNGVVTITNSALLTIAALADMNLDGAFTQNGLGSVSTGGDITTSNDDISFQQDVTLTDDVTFSSGGGDITFSSTIDGTAPGDQGISINSGSGTVTLGVIGNTINLEYVNITSSGTTNIGGNITTDNNIGTGNIDLSLASGGITLSNPLTLSSNGGDINLSGSNVSVSGAGAIIIDAETGTITIGGISVGANALTLRADEIDLTGGAGTVSGTNSITFEPSADGVSIGIAGGAGVLNLSFADMQALADGFSGIFIGRATGNSAINVNAVTFNDPVTIRSPAGAGTINVNGQITGADNASIILTSGGTTTLSADIVTSGNQVDINANVELGANITIDTTNGGGSPGGADINITGTADGNAAGRSLTLTAGAAAVDIDGNTGSTQPLAALTITGGQIEIDDIVGPAAGAGVTGLTSLTATTSITFTGTTYTANQQTYDAGAAANNIFLTSLAATGFTSSTAAISFTGETRLSNGVDLSVSTGVGGGNISMNDIRGASSEDVTLNADTGNVTVGQIGNFNNINTVDITGTTITLNGNITTSDAAGNTVTLTGNVVLGANITIDTDQAAFDGDITITGTVDGNAAGRSLTLTAGAAAVDIDGNTGSTQPLAALTITGGQIEIDDIVGPGATEGVTGLTSLTATTSITFTGTTYTANQQTYDAGAAANILDLAGGADTSFISSNDDIYFNGSITLDIPNLLVDTDTGTGSITITGTLNADALINIRNIVLTAGLGNITITGAVGGTQALDDITFNTAAIITAADIEASSGIYIYDTNGVILNRTGGPGDLTFTGDIHIYCPGATLTFNYNIICNNFVLYAGTIDLNGYNLRTAYDLVLLGPGYDDIDYEPNPYVDDIFSYDNASRAPATLADPNVALISAIPTTPPINFGEVDYDGAFSDLSLPSPSTIRVDTNFYVNGCSLTGSGAWILQIRDNDDSAIAFNEAYNMTVQNCTVAANPLDGANLGWVAAAENVTNGGGNNNWDFTQPTIVAAGTYTVSDNVIRIEFSEPIENDNDEISAAITNIGIDDNSILFDDLLDDSYTDPACSDQTDNTSDISVFYLWLDTNTWNTDADGTSSGDAASTDQSGNNQTITPDISILKDSLAVYFTIIDEHKNRVMHYMSATGTLFTGTGDRCQPVLAQVLAGTETHDIVTPENYDAHNYLEMIYSEPVDIGTLSAGVDYYNQRVTIDIFTPGSYGGNISSDGSTVTVEGFLTYADSGNLQKGSSDLLPSDALYRDAANPHSIRTYLVGYSTGVSPNYTWPGYMWNGVDPNGEPVTVSANNEIHDLQGNVLSTSFNPTITGSWDIDAPAFAEYTLSTPPPIIYEILPRDTDTNNRIDRLEFHIIDDVSAGWNSANHPDTNDGIRDTSLSNILSAVNVGVVGESATNVYNNNYDTSVNNLLFGVRITADDPYFGMVIDEASAWNTKTLLYISYDSNIGHVTDLAGNLLPTIAEARCIELIPPKIDVSLAVVGERNIYVKFSERVYGDASGDISIDALDFTLNGTTNTITSVQLLNPVGNGIEEAFLILQNDITAEDAVTVQIDPNPNAVFDSLNNTMIESHPITDIGLGVVEPIWASDGMHDDDLNLGTGGALRDFDGSGRLMDRDITLEMRIVPTSKINQPLRLFYDASPANKYLVNELWLPAIIPSFNSEANKEARMLNPFRIQGALRDFLLPSGDSEVEKDNDIEFIGQLGNLYCARVTDNDDPRTVAPWIIPIRDIVRQKGGVTILNNVINPQQGEKTIINYIIDKPGFITVLVFDLEGDIIDVLFRGTQAKGEYSFTWDGRNRGDRIVARGVYFIKVVGPGIEETRKVLVVK